MDRLSKKTKKARGIAKKKAPPPPIEKPLQYLNKEYLSDEKISELREQYRSFKPFPCIMLPNVLDEEFLNHVKEELYNEEMWYVKNNDLYTFAQTDDLKNTKLPHLAAIRDIIYSEPFRKLISGISGIELNNVIDCSGSRYWKGSTLLCHDDELEGRRIAFIFYLVPKDWKREDGGLLDLFDVNADGQPENIVNSVVPQWNSFLFFEVTPTSFHQVSEVLADKERISINGWFHGKPIKRPPLYVEPQVPMEEISKATPVNISDWINPRYLDPKMQAKIQRHFEQHSSIELKSFLKEEKFKEVEAALNSSDSKWKFIGPANRRHYESIARGNINDAHGALRECLLMLRSPDFAALLKKFTDLDLVTTCSEARRFSPGCYTLAHDNAEQHDEEGLDVYLMFAKDDDWDETIGGYMTYMTEDEELLTIVPSRNSLSMVYRAGAKLMRFVKYVQSEAPYPLIDIAALYKEDPATAQRPDENAEMDEEEGDEGDEEDDEMDEDDLLEEPDRPTAINPDEPDQDDE